MPQIIVTITPQGTPTVATLGFSGSSCQKATAELEAALGTKTQERLTAEFYHPQLAQSEQFLHQ
ncbi:DUF2997 domain-containing protein [Lacunimicrobium album]